QKLAEYGAVIVRLDAFAYAPKAVGKRNFLNEMETWQVLERIKVLADRYDLTLLPEIHAAYSEKSYETSAKQGYMTYDFFLLGLIVDALENGDGALLADWARELTEKKIRTFSILGCHDCIPMLDLKGIVPDERIDRMIELIVARSGMIKNLHGQKNVYYQVNATYYTPLGKATESCRWRAPYSCSCPASHRCGTWICLLARTILKR
ncbi:MAG: hypothetical protein RSC98_10045, partial [Clostridia bacterium]